MLVLSRKENEKIVVKLGDQELTISIIESGPIVKLGFEGDRRIQILREEIHRKIKAEEKVRDETRAENGCEHPNMKSTARKDYCPDCKYEFYYGDAHASGEAKFSKRIN